MTQTTEQITSPALATDSHPEKPVVFFDGVCGLCNHFVDFILKRDPAGKFLLAPLQGETARQFLSSEDIASLNTVVLLWQGKRYRHSSAIVRVMWILGGFWKVPTALLWIIPKPLRDLGYSCVSVMRYKLFGKKSTCRMPTPEERSRFLL